MLINPAGAICNYPHQRQLGLLAHLINQNPVGYSIQMSSSREQSQKNVSWLGLIGVGGALKWNNT